MLRGGSDHMRENEDTVIVGQRVRLVPYLPAHVDTYHAWMQDEELLRLTGSEPLTLDEERKNQQSWHDDPGKVTFIVCVLSAEGSSLGEDVTLGMCGDVNAFLWEEDVDDQPDAHELHTPDGAGSSGKRRLCAELEVMIADADQRRRGLAREALLLLLHWLLQRVPHIAALVVKITDDNLPSRRLFEALGFTVHKHLAVFEQTELRMDVDAAKAAAAQHWDAIGAVELRASAAALGPAIQACSAGDVAADVG